MHHHCIVKGKMHQQPRIAHLSISAQQVRCVSAAGRPPRPAPQRHVARAAASEPGSKQQPETAGAAGDDVL